MKKTIETVTILGSGNVATWVVHQLLKTPIKVRQVYSATLAHAQRLSAYARAQAIDTLADLDDHSDLYLLALKDDCYASVIGQIPFTMPIAVLTSGALSQNILAPAATDFGIIYPCQTFSLHKDSPNPDADFSHLEMPLCVEGNREETQILLAAFAKNLSDSIYYLNENQRNILHLAAVFASNFTNAMYATGFSLLDKYQIEHQLLLPLLKNTLYKIEKMPPWDAQTGPASRNDLSVMKKHLAMLNEERQREIYQLVSQYIIEKTNHNG